MRREIHSERALRSRYVSMPSAHDDMSSEVSGLEASEFMCLSSHHTYIRLYTCKKIPRGICLFSDDLLRAFLRAVPGLKRSKPFAASFSLISINIILPR